MYRKYYSEKLGEQKLLTREEEREMIKRIKNGDDEAREKFINLNVRLVIKIASKYQKGRESMAYDDLIQEGIIGMMHALDEFDLGKNLKFSTYATIWIIQGINRSIEKRDKNIRIPTHTVQEINKLHKLEQRFLREKERNPEEEEIAEELDWEIEKVQEIIEKKRKFGKINSLDVKITQDEAETFADRLKSDEDLEEEVVQDFYIKEANKKIKEVLDTMKEKEKIVLMERFGIDDEDTIRSGEKKTLEEIGQIIGVTREAVRQIEKRALKKLSKNKKIAKLKGMMD